MSTDGRGEHLLLSELARAVGVSTTTVYRWMNPGITINGRRIALRYIRLPTGRASSMAFYNEFVEELTKAEEEANGAAT